MPRLFTALEIPTQIAMQLSLLQSGLPGARWIDRENLHITLRFVGDVEVPVARELCYELEKVKTSPFSLKLEGLDVFGNSKPHSLFAGLARSEALMELRAEQERICQRIGLAADSRKYTPHLTIARIRAAKPAAIARYLSGFGGFQSQDFPIGRFALLSSRDSFGGGPYKTEESYKLVEENLAEA
ncbi:MAG: RNA 2',3'-cyclic phosphodiesterase [Rhizobiaceae bacterium]